jgi:hypothetical protein
MKRQRGQVRIAGGGGIEANVEIMDERHGNVRWQQGAFGQNPNFDGHSSHHHSSSPNLAARL